METGKRMNKPWLLIIMLLAGFSAFAQNGEFEENLAESQLSMPDSESGKDSDEPQLSMPDNESGEDLAELQWSIPAELNDGSTSYIIRTPDGLFINQIIVFPDVPNTFRYEVEIEQETIAGYESVQKLETAENKFEVSLKAGRYRYRITSRNRMNLAEGQSDWQTFLVLPAILPILETYQPYYGLYYEMKNTAGSITVTGRDFYSESEFALVHHKRNSDWTGVTLGNQNRVYIPDMVAVSGNKAILHFKPGNLKMGNYDILVRNPGGLWAALGQIRVGQKNWADWTISFGYSPAFAFFDLKNADYNRWDPVYGNVTHRQLDRFEARGYYFRLGFIPLKTTYGNFGIEAQLDFIVDNMVQNDWDRQPGGFGRFFDAVRFGTINLLYQNVYNEYWQHNARLGVGWGDGYHRYETLIYNPYYGWFTSYENPNALYLKLGYSAQYFIWKNLYAEAGVDFVFSHISKLNHWHFMLRPAIGIGWQGGRWAEWAEVARGAKKGEDYSVPVTDKPRAEWLVSLGWAPMIPLTGYDRYGWNVGYYGSPSVSPGYTSDVMLGNFNPLGFNLRAAYIPLHWGDNKLGIEFEMSILNIPGRQKMQEKDRWWPLISETVLGVRYQRVLSENWQANFRVALGMIPLYVFQTGSGGKYFSDSYTLDLGFKFGASAQYFFWKNAYVEGSIDIVLTKAERDEYYGMSSDPRLYFRPSIAIGWQFNRNTETGLRLSGKGIPYNEETKEPVMQQTEAPEQYPIEHTEVLDIDPIVQTETAEEESAEE